jgi:hydrogenase maturation factor
MRCEHGEGCITCGDRAEEMRVTAVDTARELALCVDGDGRKETVDIGLVSAVADGDLLLVHAGTALTRVGPG